MICHFAAGPSAMRPPLTSETSLDIPPKEADDFPQEDFLDLDMDLDLPLGYKTNTPKPKSFYNSGKPSQTKVVTTAHNMSYDAFVNLS